MATRGPRRPADDDARRALRCALAIQNALTRLNAAHDDAQPALSMDIAAHRGDAITGNIGSLQRVKFGVVGDLVNLCARIKGLTLPGEVLVSEALHDAIGEDADVDAPRSVRVKGQDEPVRAHGVRGYAGLTLPAKTPAPLASVQWVATMGRVVDRQLERDGKEVRIVAISTERVRVATAAPLAAGAEVVLRPHLPDGTQTGEAYAKALPPDADGADSVLLRFTSLRDVDAQAVLAGAVSRPAHTRPLPARAPKGVWTWPGRRPRREHMQTLWISCCA